VYDIRDGILAQGQNMWRIIAIEKKRQFVADVYKLYIKPYGVILE
jgi:hypothetical protein